MSLADELAALTAASQEFDQKFAVKLAQKVEATEKADNAKALDGQTVAQVNQSLRGPLDQHAANQNAHGISIGQLGGKTTQQIDTATAKQPRMVDLPISRYGDLGYLPAGVAGSFEGASTNEVYRNVYMFMENEGTLVYLRNGINGSKQGVYYAHLKDAMNPDVVGQPIKTNRRYQPAFFPVGQTAAFIEGGASNPDVLLGRLQDVNGVLQNYFVALTNGTLDDTVHTGGFITPAVHNSLGLGRGIAFIAADQVWFVTPDLTDGFQLKIATAPVSDFTNGATVTPTRVTGITTTGFGGVVYSAQQNIKLAAMIRSAQAADKPMLLCQQADAWANAIRYDIPALSVGVSSVNGQWRIKVASYSWGAYNGAGLGKYLSFTLLYNPTTKIATLEAEFQPQSELSFPGGATPVLYTGPLYDWDMIAEGITDSSNSCPSFCYTGKFSFTYRQYQGSDSLVMTRGEYGSSISQFDRLRKGALAHIATRAVGISPNYGSAAGSNIVGGQFISVQRLLFSAKGRRMNGNFYDGPAWGDCGGDIEYEYNSLNNGKMKGYPPDTNRYFFVDSGINDANLSICCGVTEAIENGAMQYSTLNLSGLRLVGKNRIDANFNSQDGTTEVTSAVLLQAAQATLNAANISAAEFSAQLIIPRLLAGVIPAVLVVPVIRTDRLSGLVVAGVTLTYTDNKVTGIRVDNVSPMSVRSSQTLGLSVDTTNISRYGGYGIYRNGDDVFIGGTCPTYFSVVGGAPVVAWRARYNAATKQWTWPNNLGALAYHYNAGAVSCISHPTLGFGWTYGTRDTTDTGTKLAFVPIAKTAAQFDSYVEPPVANWRVLMAQDVAAGWLLYFTEPTPILMAGHFYTIPPTEFDLASIKADPSNTVFYVYAMWIPGGEYVTYDVSLVKLEETSRLMYLGYIATGASSIETLALEKVTRIDTYRLSPVARGSAIAVTSGPVSDPAVLPWS